MFVFFFQALYFPNVHMNILNLEISKDSQIQKEKKNQNKHPSEKLSFLQESNPANIEHYRVSIEQPLKLIFCKF